jgi:hypothetical protein
MSKYGVLAGSADYEIHVQFLNADGTPADDLVAEDVAISYRRPGTNDLVSISLTDLTDLDDAHTDGGFKHAMGGAYRLCLPDAAIASGAPFVEVFGAGEGVVMVKEVVELRGYDHTDTPPEIDPQDIDDAKTAAQAAQSAAESAAAVTDKLDPMLESDGDGGYQFTETALENAPAGEGGSGPSASEIRSALGMSSANLDTQLSGIASSASTAASAAGSAASDAAAAKTAAQSADTKLGTPAGASVSADLAAVKSDTGSTKTRVEKALPDAVPGEEGGLPVLDENDLVHADTKRMNAAKVIGTGVEGDLWRGEEA